LSDSGYSLYPVATAVARVAFMGRYWPCGFRLPALFPCVCDRSAASDCRASRSARVSLCRDSRCVTVALGTRPGTRWRYAARSRTCARVCAPCRLSRVGLCTVTGLGTMTGREHRRQARDELQRAASSARIPFPIRPPPRDRRELRCNARNESIDCELNFSHVDVMMKSISLNPISE
jgi:hypothetical protein